MRTTIIRARGSCDELVGEINVNCHVHTYQLSGIICKLPLLISSLDIWVSSVSNIKQFIEMKCVV
jgi:hypothetical protein